MWTSLTGFIIRNRLLLVGILVILTVYMGYRAKDAHISYEMVQVVPTDHPEYVQYQDFKKQFGNDGAFFVIGFRTTDIYKQGIFEDWWNLAHDIESVEGVESVEGLPTLVNVVKDTSAGVFKTVQVFPRAPKTQAEMDSSRKIAETLKFFNGLFNNPRTGATLLAIKIDQQRLFTKERVGVINHISEKAEDFAERWNVQMHYSGLPYVKAVVADQVSQELSLFVIYSVIITSLILLLFFRSFQAVVFPLIVIGIVVIWTMGTLGILHYQITLLTGIIPALIVITGVPNFIYFFNKYHQEYRKHGNKMRAITRMVEKIGVVSLLVNLTTAVGCGVLVLTKSPVLVEFGVVAFINITLTFFISIILIPVVFIYMPAPREKHLGYMDNRWMAKVLNFADRTITQRRPMVFGAALAVIALSVFGIMRLKSEGFILDDIPRKNTIYKDLIWFEQNFDGVMPFEVLLDTGKKRGLIKLENLKLIAELQDTMETIPGLSQSLSLADISKFARQAFYNGDSAFYTLPEKREQGFLLRYLKGLSGGSDSIAQALTDTTLQYARISVKAADVGSVRMKGILTQLDSACKVIFAGTDFKWKFTGTSVLFMHNNHYLISSMGRGLWWSILIIMLTVLPLFRSPRKILITLIPNLIPLAFTAGMMGYFGIPLKPSTVIIFSIAFGITIDSSLHLLAKYKQELENHSYDLDKIVRISTRETAASIIYTTVVLFFGFGIFALSSFGGTVALGVLVSFTLLVGMISNTLLLPSLLLTFDRKSPKRKVWSRTGETDSDPLP